MPQFHTFRAEAVVLRHADWGEADRIITLYTRQEGKIRALAKGARKLLSRKAGHLEPFTRIHLQLARSRDLPIITQVETQEAYLPLQQNLLRLTGGLYALELIDRFTYEGEGANIPLYHLLVETLQRLAAQEEGWLALRYYEVRLLDLLGFRPQLFQCANCGREIQPQNQFFSPLAGGVLCPSCGTGLPGVLDVETETLKYLRHFQRSNYEQAVRAQPPEAQKRKVERLTQAYLTYLLERSLNTPGFLKRLGSA